MPSVGQQDTPFLGTEAAITVIFNWNSRFTGNTCSLVSRNDTPIPPFTLINDNIFQAGMRRRSTKNVLIAGSGTRDVGHLDQT